VDSLVLETVVGLVFVFAVFASVVSVLTEVIARFIGLRGEYLMRGLRTLLDGGGEFSLNPFQRTSEKPDPAAPADPLIARVLSKQLLQVCADKGVMPPDAGNAKLSNKDRRTLPSYLSARSVAQSLIAVLVPDPQGATTLKEIRDGLANVEDARVRAALTQMVAQAEGDVARFESVYNAYSQAPEVTRQRMYIETIEEIMQKSKKIILDTKSGNGNMIYLPLDKLMERNAARAAPAASAPAANEELPTVTVDGRTRGVR